MSEPADFTKLVPGFDFLQGLVKSAGSALPAMGQWVAPTLNPEELDKRIGELRTVQFWLEQNARLLATTIQALEVQRMTLSTLKTMNVKMSDLRDSLKVRMPDAPASPAPADGAAAKAHGEEPAAAPAPGAVDPMQWWGALTQQFTELAASAIQEGAAASKQAAEPPKKAAAKRARAPAVKKRAATAAKR